MLECALEWRKQIIEQTIEGMTEWTIKRWYIQNDKYTVYERMTVQIKIWMGGIR